ncbi:MAG: SUMF1/EgtB/PvdO family nonheme iron enzyme, partial [Verrucomicrobia bacterium]|nr:SUMF1/EgtB/PvdO family nonheme iron enzyme [Verrucomicrobiota bacterium]
LRSSIYDPRSTILDLRSLHLEEKIPFARSFGFCWNVLMKTLLVLSGLCFVSAPAVHAQIASGERVAPKMEISGDSVNLTIQPSVIGRNYQLQYSDTMAGDTWQDTGVVRSGDGGNLVISTPYVAGTSRLFYRVALVEATPAPAGFSLISEGSFLMGDQSNPLVGSSPELPVHKVYVSAFYMAKHEVTQELWNEVKTWGATHGYTDLPTGASKGANHPVHSISWHAMVKWCNARSQKEGLNPCYTISGVYKTGSGAPVCHWSLNGYRLPSEAEWEKAARGGLSAQNFPWGNTISHSQANYCVYSSNGTTNDYIYDVAPRPPGTVYEYFHPTYAVNGYSYTSPVGSFTPNGYGLYDMAGNLWEWCWDWYAGYPSTSQSDPRGPESGAYRVFRGGDWNSVANSCRVAFRNDGYYPANRDNLVGFRLARTAVP